MTETHRMNTKARTLQRRGPGRAGGSSVSVFLSLSLCVCERERETRSKNDNDPWS